MPSPTSSPEKTPLLVQIFKLLPVEIWTFLALTLVSFIFLVSFVNLTPVVDDDFFFSSNDPQFQSEHTIDRLFIRKDTQMIIAATGDIYSKEYRNKVYALSESLLHIDGVTSVNSLTHFGPKDITDALKSPLWKRVIISDDQKSSNIIILLKEKNQSEIVNKVENLLQQYDAEGFHLRAAGLPYVIELIRRNLTRDLQVFSIIAFLVFGFLIFSFFHSKSILIGTLLSCLNACIWTYMVTSLTNIPVGLLTATLGTIIFVMTLSHIIFLTFNWRKAVAQKSTRPVEEAMKQTFPPSFWSMFTTLLGFLSLMSVPAKPLRDLGAAGITGSLVAIAVAYGFFPAFLRMARPGRNRKGRVERLQERVYTFFHTHKKTIATMILVSAFLALPGLGMVNSDPSLLSYFSKNSEIYKGFKYIDRNGGSSPLILVIRRKDNQPLNTNKAYEKMWDLQNALEQHRAVGSVISLPVLIAQAKQVPLGWILPQEFLLNAMESPEFDEIAKSFVTQDRKYGLYLLRMNEEFRTLPRVDIVEEIKNIARVHGFVPEIVGGVYNLQGHLAKLVASSLVFGIAKLLFFFAIVAWIISRSVPISLSVLASVALIPLTVFGLIGVYRVPLDIVAAPACNVAIAMGVDAMIHMIQRFRKTKDWAKVREELWQPVLTAMLVVCTGFAIFLTSTFPPTQRFGATIFCGSFLAGMIALFILPLFHQFLEKIKGKYLKR